MTRHLHISQGLSVPLSWMTLATVVYGARGAGKTTLGSVIAEEIHKSGQRFCAVDLKGDFYGLKSSADGRHEGIPVVVFGGDHEDVPLEEGAGAFIGETIAHLQQPAIIDLERFSKGKQVRFLAAFFEALYDHNREPLLLLLDEAQRYAPQKPIDPDAAKCLGMVEDVVKLGRKHGIGPVLFTQRGSGLNKEVSELCDMLVAFRTPGPLDQDRVKDWLDANTTKAQRDEVMGQLAGLPTGTAVFASGHPDLRIFGTYAVRRRETFDSSATPKVGHRRAEPRRLAKPDLEQLRQKMAAAIERARAEDPKALRAELAATRKELEQLRRYESVRAQVEKVVEKRVEVPVLRNGDVKALHKVASTLERLSFRIDDSVRQLQGAGITIAGATQPIFSELSRIQSARSAVPSSSETDARPSTVISGRRSGPVERVRRGDDGTAVRTGARAEHGQSAGVPVQPTTPAPSRVTVARAGPGPVRTTEGISRPQQRILDALARIEASGLTPRKRGVVAALAEQSPKSSGYEKNVSTLSSRGLIHYPGPNLIALTDAGRQAADAPDAPATSEQLLEMACRMVSGPQGRMLRVLAEHYPMALTRAELAERSGQSVASSGFEKNVSTLSSFGWVVYPAKGEVSAAPELFLERVS